MFSRTKVGGATKAPKQVAVVSAQTRTQTTAQTLAAAQAVVELQAVARGHSSRKLVNGVREAVAAETLVAMNLVRCLRASRRAHARMTTFPCAHAQRAPCPPLAAQLGSELEYLNALTEVCERFEVQDPSMSERGGLSPVRARASPTTSPSVARTRVRGAGSARAGARSALAALPPRL